MTKRTIKKGIKPREYFTCSLCWSPKGTPAFNMHHICIIASNGKRIQASYGPPSLAKKNNNNNNHLLNLCYAWMSSTALRATRIRTIYTVSADSATACHENLIIFNEKKKKWWWWKKMCWSNDKTHRSFLIMCVYIFFLFCSSIGPLSVQPWTCAHLCRKRLLATPLTKWF